MRRIGLTALLLVSVFMASGCAFLTWDPASTTLTATVRTTTGFTTLSPGGTITVVASDYGKYPAYQSPAYDLTDVQVYNDHLLQTRDDIIAANIQVSATMYQTVVILPGITRTVVSHATSGSGVLFAEDEDFYYALTNFHVLDPGNDDPVYQIMAFGDTIPAAATMVCFDRALDLAVLQFEKAGRTQPRLIDWTTRLSRKINEGELVLAVGNPEGLENNVTFGEFVRFVSVEDYSYPVIQHSATIDNGSSGGALVDVDGILVGINTWGSETDPLKSFAIPIYLVYVFLYNNGFCQP